MQTTKTPYEFLVRWDAQGRLSGAHVQFRYVTTGGDGVVLGEFLGPAEPVAVGAAGGFPLADILNDVQTAALAAVDRLQKEVSVLTNQTPSEG